MHITNFVFKAFFSVAVLSLTSLSLAHEGHHSTAQTDGKNVPSMNHQAMSEMDHSQHSPQEHAQHMQMMGKMKRRRCFLRQRPHESGPQCGLRSTLCS